MVAMVKFSNITQAPDIPGKSLLDLCKDAAQTPHHLLPQPLGT